MKRASIWLVLLWLACSTGSAQQKITTMKASWYGKQFHGRTMANGKPFNMYKLTAASKTLPFGTCLLITNPTNGGSVVVEVTDRGPYVAGRDIDLSMAAAERLGIKNKGVQTVVVERINCGVLLAAK